MQFKRNIAEVFENLSGSVTFKQQYELLVAKKLESEDQVRILSEKLKEKRHEKIKLRGLSDYQKQIEICISEQKDTEMVLQILSILVKDTEIAHAHSKTEDVANSSDTTLEKRKISLNEIKKMEGELRKLEN